MKQNEDVENESDVEHETTARAKRKSVASLAQKNVKKGEEIDNNTTKSYEANNKNDSDEDNQLLKKLEASSKGTVKKSLVWSYLKSAKHPFTLFCLIVSILLTQILVSTADIWMSHW